MISHSTVYAGGLAMDGSSKWPIDFLKPQKFAIFVRQIWARCQVMATTEMFIAFTSNNGTTNIFIFPQVYPGGRNVV